jgi:outer membrane immunogenic protein
MASGACISQFRCISNGERVTPPLRRAGAVTACESGPWPPSLCQWLQSNTGRKSAEYPLGHRRMPFSNGNFVAVMKKLTTAIAAIALIGTPAFAAQPPPPAPVYSWTGFYVGGNVGYSWGNANTDVVGNGTLVARNLHPPPLNFSNPFNFAASNSARPNGVIGGGQIGYNYQFSPNGVLGFEADIQGSGERGSGQLADPFSIIAGSATAGPLAALTNYQTKIDWFGTVRGRLGIVVGDQLLIYGTGGLAYGKVAISGSSVVTGLFAPGIPVASNVVAFGDSKANIGFAVGAGMEGRLSDWLPPNWTWKLEYLYLDLGTLDTTTPPFVVTSLTPAAVLSPTSGTINTHTHFTDNIVRVGLNYQFH